MSLVGGSFVPHSAPLISSRTSESDNSQEEEYRFEL